MLIVAPLEYSFARGGGGGGGGGTLYIPGGEISLANLTLGGQGRRNLIIDNTSTHLGFN